MENLTLISPNSPLTLTSSTTINTISTKQCFGLPLLPKRPTGLISLSRPTSKRTVLSAFSTPNSNRKVTHSKNYTQKNGGVELFASTSTTSVGVNPPQPYVSPPPSQFGSPLFWIGVGVGFSALFSFVSARVKKYAMQQAFKTMMGPMASQNNQFGNAAFPSGSPFGFPPPSTPGPGASAGFPYVPPTTSGPSTGGFTYGTPSTSGPSTVGSTYPSTSGPGSSNVSASSFASVQPTSPSPAAASSVTMDVSETKSKAAEPETETESKQSAFVDVSPEETLQSSPFENYNGSSSSSSWENAKVAEVVQNGAASKGASSSDGSQSTRNNGSLLSVETLEKMMEDPQVQQMIYPHLPEEMRNPTTFKWMLQNPVYRQQLQEMLDNMGGDALGDRMVDTIKNFDLNSPEVKEQFAQIGLTPQEAISRLMANPDISMAFQNPKIQQAVMDCSANPMNIVKYQNDKEVMDVFNKIQELFPGPAGPGF